MAKKNNFKLIILIIVFAILNIACFAMLVNIEQTGAFERITGFELKQRNGDLVATWDDVKKAEAYDVSTKHGSDISIYEMVENNNYVINNPEEGMKYVISVSAIINYKKETEKVTKRITFTK